MPASAAGDRALFIGKGFLGLGTARLVAPELAYSIEAFQDDPVRGVVRFFPDPVPVSSLEPWRIADGRAGALAFVDGPWSAFSFGTHGYDPFGSIGESLARAADTATDGDDGGRWKAGLATALWAAMEGDLYRFAFDMTFIHELETQRDSGEWKRFARLNDLYRACIRAIVPYGIAPSAWSDWLRGSVQAAGSQTGPRRALERALTRPVDAIAGVIAVKVPPDGIFSIPLFDRV